MKKTEIEEMAVNLKRMEIGNNYCLTLCAAASNLFAAMSAATVFSEESTSPLTIAAMVAEEKEGGDGDERVE